MSDPKKQHVIGKKPIVAERTLTERSFCEIDQYYYSEMFTCPICYGRDTEQERIVNTLKDYFAFAIEAETEEYLEEAANLGYWSELCQISFNQLIDLIKGEQK